MESFRLEGFVLESDMRMLGQNQVLRHKSEACLLDGGDFTPKGMKLLLGEWKNLLLMYEAQVCREYIN